MKRDWVLLSGWAAGVFAAATVVLLVQVAFDDLRAGQAEIAMIVLMLVILGAGPGLLILSVFLSLRLRRLREGRTRGATLALGTLVGGFLGLPAVLLAPLLFIGADILLSFSTPLGPESLMMFGMGVVGGATTGFTCAWRVTAPPKEAA